VTRSVAWRAVHDGGRPPAPAAAPPETPLESGPTRRSGDDASGVQPCVFCDRPSGSAVYAWPDWLCRFMTDHLGDWNVEGPNGVPSPAILERMEREVDKTVTCVCDTCASGWMQRLEDNVSPLLQSLALGEPNPLPAARRKLLARWAAKTAVVMESASRTWIRTPKFACEHLRKVGVHPGTQVLVGRYDGQAQILTHERDLFSTTVDGEKRHVSQATFVIGKLLIQVFADPWRDTTPQLAEGVSDPFIPLLGGNGRVVHWPPALSIDDRLYDLARFGPIDEESFAPPALNVQGT
jgi:hypothetical protein